MTHNRDHIVIHQLSQPVSFGTEKPTKCRVWWFAVLPLVTGLIGFLVGLAC